MSEIFGYLIVEKDVDISTLPYENEEYTLLPGSIAYVVGGGAYMLTPSNRWQFLDQVIQKIVLPVFKNVSSSGGSVGGGGGSSGLVVNITEGDGTHDLVADKTWQEMLDAVSSGGVVNAHLAASEYWNFPEEYVPFLSIYSFENGDSGNMEYDIAFLAVDGSMLTFSTDSTDGYPSTYRAAGGNPT